MEWFNTIIGALIGIITALFGSVMYFRPKLKEARAEADKAEIEASDARVTYLVKRVESVERLYAEQGRILDAMRKKQIDLEQAIAEKDKRIAQLEAENKELRETFSTLELKVEDFKKIRRNGNGTNIKS